MNQKVFFLGIAGVVLFTITCTIGGFLIEGYSIQSQYISETYAIDTQYGLLLRLIGHIPSGILFTLFGFLAYPYFPSNRSIKWGWIGIALSYGVGTILVAVFPCDSGCNRDFINPSTSQVIHNIMGLVVYVFMPVSITIIGVGLRKYKAHRVLCRLAITIGLVSLVWVSIFLADNKSPILGFHQRGIEILFLIWILASAFWIKNRKQEL